MQITTSSHRSARIVPGASLAFGLALTAAALPSQAQDHGLYAETTAGTSHYQYNTYQGVVHTSGTSSGTTALGAPEATSYSFADEGNGVFHGVTTAAGSADYATAGLHARVLTEGFSQGRVRTQLDDVITFNVAGADASTVTRVGLDLTLDGMISAYQDLSYLYDLKMFAGGRPGLSVGWTTALYDTPDDPRNYVGYAVSGGTGAPSGFESFELLADSATTKHFHGIFTLNGAQTAFGLLLGFSLQCSSGTDCDFGNSGHLSFDLPDNVAFTSASGLLLSGATVPAVPEPETYALILGGLAMTGWISRRRRAASR
ncbi:MAG: PEP-CTERM sorting domain-containing protein [Caldimonas sp.]